MPRSILVSLLVVVAAVATRAAAQTLAPVRPLIAKVPTVAATTSFSAYTAFGVLVGKPINLALDRVEFDGNARLSGQVMFTSTDKSWAYLTSPAGLPNGNYSVQLDFSSVSQPATITITRGNTNTVQATCSVTSTALSCASGTFAITDGQLSLSMTMTQGYQAILSKVTINQLQ